MLDGGLTVRVPAARLRKMIDHFWDTGMPSNPEHSFRALMHMCRKECSEAFIEDIRTNGIQTPCDVDVFTDEQRIEFQNGHHRMALALVMGLDVPVTKHQRWDAGNDLRNHWED